MNLLNHNARGLFSRLRVCRFSLPPAACFLCGLFAASAQAIDVTEGINFAGPSQNFNLGLTVKGPANPDGTLQPFGKITVFGDGEFHELDVDAGFFDISSHQDIDIPFQEVNLSLNPDTVTFSSSPVGSATLGFDNVTLDNATLANTEINFNNSTTWNFAFDQITFDIDVSGLLGNVKLRLDITGSITALSFTQDPGTVSAGIVTNLPGVLVADYEISVTAEIDEVIGDFGFDLGEIFSLDDSTDSAVDLPGGLVLTDLGGGAPSDLKVDYGLDLSPLPSSFLTFPFSQPETTVSQIQGHGTGNVDLNLTYSIEANLVLDNVLYALNDTLVGVVVPEPCSLGMLGLGILSSAAIWRRRRTKQVVNPPDQVRQL